MTQPSGQLHASWQAAIGEEFDKPYMQTLRAFLKEEKAAGKVIYPPGPLIFNAFNHTPFDQVKMSGKGDLTPWAEQGVLLLNATLTVEQANAGSHQKRGWEEFTDAAITALNAQRENLVFVLWGSYAQKKGAAIDANRHLVLKSVHPSPLSAHRGFFGNHQFSKINDYLVQHGQIPINWQL